MTFRYLGRLALAADILILLYIAFALTAPVAAQMKHEDYHPEWLRKSWCCGEHDTRRVRVAYLPAGWHIVWIENPPGYPRIRLRRPLHIRNGQRTVVGLSGSSRYSYMAR